MAKKSGKGIYKSKSRLAFTGAEAQQNDYFFLNNPVFCQGFAMAAAVGGAVNLRAAVILAITGVILILPIRIIGEFTVGIVKSRLRILVYALLGAIIIVPDLALVDTLFGADAMLVGVWAMLLFIDSVVCWRAEVEQREGIRNIFTAAITTAAGYAFALCLIGGIRELLASGTLWGVKVLPFAMWPAAETLPVGLVIVALLAALWQLLGNATRKLMYQGGGRSNG